MIEGRGVVDIRCTRDDVIAFVTDLARYKLADLKIGRIYETSANGDGVFHMRHGGTLRGLPGPPVSLTMIVDESGAHYRGEKRGLASMFLSFDGGFDIEENADGVRVTHVERFHFHVPWRLLAEPFLRAWLQRDVEAEVVRIKALLEAPVSRAFS